MCHTRAGAVGGSQTAYESLLARVDKPGRYLGNERGMVQKDPTTVALRFALAFPDVYEIAQSHPGLQILYDILNRRPDVYAERGNDEMRVAFESAPAPRQQALGTADEWLSAVLRLDVAPARTLPVCKLETIIHPDPRAASAASSVQE